MTNDLNITGQAKRMYLETIDIVLPRVNQILTSGTDLGPLIINAGTQPTTIVPIGPTENQR